MNTASVMTISIAGCVALATLLNFWFNNKIKQKDLDKLITRVDRLELQRDEFIRLETKVDFIMAKVEKL